MTISSVAARRLRAQRLTGEPFQSAIEAVYWFGAVQAQDYGGAIWALGLRTRGATAAQINTLFNAGAILRTHVLRPTWHFVYPEDLRWLLALTGPRVRHSLAGRWRQLEIDENVVARAHAAFIAALSGGRALTRPELGAVLRAAGIAPDGQRLPHLLMAAELDGLIVSGPRRGKQFTYALLEERAPAARTLDRDEALAQIARRYIRSHGPAQLQDFVWWSGLSVADARTGLALAGDALARQEIDGATYWFDATANWDNAASPHDTTTAAHPLPNADQSTVAGLLPGVEEYSVAHLLPNFDEYTVAYRDRAAAVHADRPFDPALFSFGSILSNVVLVDGRVRGAWTRTLAGKSVRVELRLLDRLDAAETRAVEGAADVLARFLASPIRLAWL